MFRTDQTEAHQGAFSHATSNGKRNHLLYDHRCVQVPNGYTNEDMGRFHDFAHHAEILHPDKLHAHWRSENHTCHIGPLCERAFADQGDFPTCSHHSCADLLMEQCYACMYAAMDESGQTDPILCEKHGWTCIIDAGHNSGFAGEGLWWENLACGCSNVEEGHYTDN